MSDFKSKMHQIQFRLGLRPKPRWGSLQRSPRPLAGFKGPISKAKEGIRENAREWVGKRNRRVGKARGREGGEEEEKIRGAYRDEGPLTKILNTPLHAFDPSLQI